MSSRSSRPLLARYASTVASSASGPGASSVHGRASTAVPGAPACAGTPSRRRRTSSRACRSTASGSRRCDVARVGRLGHARAAIGRPVAADHRHRARLAGLLAGARAHEPGDLVARSALGGGRSPPAAGASPSGAARPRRRRRARPAGAGDRLLEQRLDARRRSRAAAACRSARGRPRAAVLPALGFTRSLPAYALQARKRIVSRSSSSSRQPASRSMKSIAPRIEAPWRRSGWTRATRARGRRRRRGSRRARRRTGGVTIASSSSRAW